MSDEIKSGNTLSAPQLPAAEQAGKAAAREIIARNVNSLRECVDALIDHINANGLDGYDSHLEALRALVRQIETVAQGAAYLARDREALIAIEESIASLCSPGRLGGGND